MDQPYNLLPSLHIAFCTILAQFFGRHTSGLLRYSSNTWFLLIAFSAVLTYQHHVMDVVGGFALGAYCLYFIRDAEPRLPLQANRRVGAYYAIGALLVASLVFLWWPWGVFLVWPALSLAIAAAGYFALGSRIFHKCDGRLPWTTWWALGPCLLGQYLSWLYYRGQCRAWDQLTPRVWIGSVLTRREAAAISEQGVTAVLDLTAEFSAPAALRVLSYRNIPILDLTAPTLAQLHEMVMFIEDESRKGIVYLHCKVGYSRSAAAAGAYLLRSGRATTVAEAIDLLRTVRPTIIVRPEIVAALTDFSSPQQRAAS